MRRRSRVPAHAVCVCWAHGRRLGHPGVPQGEGGTLGMLGDGSRLGLSTVARGRGGGA